MQERTRPKFTDPVSIQKVNIASSRSKLTCLYFPIRLAPYMRVLAGEVAEVELYARMIDRISVIVTESLMGMLQYCETWFEN
jgi:hypothetical protein